jgi:hypothetical protein
MIVGISLSKKLADKYGKRDVYKYGLLTCYPFCSDLYLFQT